MPLLMSLVPKEKLLAYQFAFDLAKDGSQEIVHNELPEDDPMGIIVQSVLASTNHAIPRI
jgi:hypothetical protein